MSGLPPKFFSFFKGLEKDNTKSYFEANRADYETYVKAPFHALVQDIIDRIRKQEPTLATEPKDAIFRINRDIRFSKDKSPYKTFCAAQISKHNKKSMNAPKLYFQIGAAGGFIGGGLYMPEKDDLAAARSLIVEKSAEFNKILKAKKFVELFGELRGERNKIVPLEFRDAALKNPLIANKQFFWGADLSSSEVRKPDLDSMLYKYYLAQKPAQDFFDQLL